MVLLCCRCLWEHGEDACYVAVTVAGGEALCREHALTRCPDCARPVASAHAPTCARQGAELLIGDALGLTGRRRRRDDGALEVADEPGVGDTDALVRAALDLVMPHVTSGADAYNVAADVETRIRGGAAPADAARAALEGIGAA